MERANLITLMLVLIAGLTIVAARPQQQQSNAPSERLFDLSGLFNRYQPRPYPGGGGIYQSGSFYPAGGYQNGFGGIGSNYPSGTNMLGGGFGGGFGNGYGNSFGHGGGYGGYGGYGGNGNLQTYRGYNSNYDGQRNLGFGYYRGTDSYGFLPSREANYYSGTGYRGYN